MMKVVLTSKRAVAVRYMGCGINGHIVKRLLLSGTNGHITFDCHGPQGSRRRGKEKPDKKEIHFGLP